MSEYYKDKKCYGGHRPTCKTCCKIYYDNYNKLYPEARQHSNTRQKELNARSNLKAKHRFQPWDKEQDDFIREFWNSEDAIEIALSLGRSLMAVRKRASYLGVKKDHLIRHTADA